MTGQEATFYAFAAVAVLSAGALIVDRRPARAGAWAGLCLGSLAVPAAMTYAWVPAVALAIAGLWVGAEGRARPDAERAPGPPWWLTGLLAVPPLAVIGFVLVSTVTRQYVTFGFELENYEGVVGPQGRRAAFGDAPDLLSVLFRDHTAMVYLLGFVLLVAMALLTSRAWGRGEERP